MGCRARARYVCPACLFAVGVRTWDEAFAIAIVDEHLICTERLRLGKAYQLKGVLHMCKTEIVSGTIRELTA
jgi:hypothetical protein